MSGWLLSQDSLDDQLQLDLNISFHVRCSNLDLIILVGTSHTIQTTDLELKPYLEHLCREFKVRALAEEMSQEALAEKGYATSIPKQVASALQISHRFCDPTRAERIQLGIRQENDIRLDAGLSKPKLSESKIQALIRESHAKREQFWLNQLRDLKIWPILFVCGADHVASLCGLLKQQNIVVHVAAKDWKT